MRTIAGDVADIWLTLVGSPRWPHNEVLECEFNEILLEHFVNPGKRRPKDSRPTRWLNFLRAMVLRDEVQQEIVAGHRPEDAAERIAERRDSRPKKT